MKNINKQIASFLIILTLVFSSLSLPAITPRAKATGLPVVDILGNFLKAKDVVRMIVDGIAMGVAQKMTNDIVKSTINWANTGFEGNPTFVTDPVGFTKRSADSAVGLYINDSKFNSLCTPFQGKIQLALRNSYLSPQDQQVQCSFSGIKGNLEGFYGDFNSEGWQGWISMTQNPTNNPYDVYMTSKIEMDSRLANTLGVQQKELDINKNFLSTKDCIAKNPTDAEIAEYTMDPVGSASTGNPIATGKKKWDPTKPGSACIEYGPVKTPGSQIANQIEKAVPSGMQKLITVDHVEQLIGAFASGLINRYILGPQGLFSKKHTDSYGASDTPPPTNTSGINPKEGSPDDGNPTVTDFCIGLGCRTVEVPVPAPAPTGGTDKPTPPPSNTNNGGGNEGGGSNPPVIFQ
ncbi:MAG: hypothetical protein WAV25_01260 [Minisyncoccia bacterium]